MTEGRRGDSADMCCSGRGIRRLRNLALWLVSSATTNKSAEPGPSEVEPCQLGVQNLACRSTISCSSRPVRFLRIHLQHWPVYPGRCSSNHLLRVLFRGRDPPSNFAAPLRRKTASGLGHHSHSELFSLGIFERSRGTHQLWSKRLCWK